MAKILPFLLITAILFHFFAIIFGESKNNQIGTSNTQSLLFQILGDEHLIYVKHLSKSLSWMLFRIQTQRSQSQGKYRKVKFTNKCNKRQNIWSRCLKCSSPPLPNSLPSCLISVHALVVFLF